MPHPCSLRQYAKQLPALQYWRLFLIAGRGNFLFQIEWKQRLWEEQIPVFQYHAIFLPALRYYYLHSNHHPVASELPRDHFLKVFVPIQQNRSPVMKPSGIAGFN